MITKRWLEVENECLGPLKQGRQWDMYLFVHSCRKIKRCNGVVCTQKKRLVHHVQGKTKKELVQNLDNYISQPGVVLLAA